VLDDDDDDDQRGNEHFKSLSRITAMNYIFFHN